MLPTVGVHVVLLVVAALTTGVLAGDAWRREHKQGARAFVALMITCTVYSATHLVGLLTLDPWWRLFWENVQWVATATVPVFWILFAAAYTGHDELLDGWVGGLVAAVPLGTIVLTWTNPAHGLMWAENAVVVVDGLALLDQTFGPWFWVYTVHTYVLTVAGAFLFLRLIWASDRLYADQAALLAVGATAPLVASVLTVTGLSPLPGPQLDITPYAFAVSGVAFAFALFRYRLFDLVPATRRLGRAAAIHDLDDGLLIVDTDREVVYCNPTAAAILGCEPTAALGEPVRSLVDESALDFDTEDALAEIEREDRVYEVRTSPIHDRRDRLAGHTLVLQDVTDRVRRERRLARQRDELARLDELNAVIRGVNRALVSAGSRAEIERTVCERLSDSDRYRAACAADLPTWNGEADRWTAVSTDGGSPAPPTPADGFDPEVTGTAVATTSTDPADGTWTVVPLVYGRTVYGAIGLYAAPDGPAELTEREREVLTELGELIGHAIDAVENRRLLAAESVVELEFRSRDADGTLLGAATEADCRFELTGFVPKGGDGDLAYVRVEGAPTDRAADALATASGNQARPVGDPEEGGLVEWTVGDDTLVGTLAEHGANVLTAAAEGDRTRVVIEVASGANGRALLDRVRRAFPHTSLHAKRERDRPVDPADGLPDTATAGLTDRQREALEAAYRAGYFDWPRESTAEEVAEALDIAPPTLHAHLRKAESTLFADLFEREGPTGE